MKLSTQLIKMFNIFKFRIYIWKNTKSLELDLNLIEFPKSSSFLFIRSHIFSFLDFLEFLEQHGQYQLTFSQNKLIMKVHPDTKMLNVGIFCDFMCILCIKIALQSCCSDHQQLDILDFLKITHIFLIYLLANEIVSDDNIRNQLSTSFPQSLKVYLRSQMLNQNGSIILAFPQSIQNRGILNQVVCEPKCLVNGSKIQFPQIQFNQKLKFLNVHNIILTPYSQHNTQFVVQILSSARNVMDTWNEKFKFGHHFQKLQSCSFAFISQNNQKYSLKVKLLSKSILESSMILFQFPSDLKQEMTSLYPNSNCVVFVNRTQNNECFYDKVSNEVRIPLQKWYSGQFQIQLQSRFHQKMMNSIQMIKLKVLGDNGISFSLMQQMRCLQQFSDTDVEKVLQTGLKQNYYNSQPYLQIAYRQNMWGYGYYSQTLVFTMSGYPTYNPDSANNTFILIIPSNYQFTGYTTCGVSNQYNCFIVQNFVFIYVDSNLPPQITIYIQNITNPSSYPTDQFYIHWQFGSKNIQTNTIPYPINCTFPCLSCNQSTQCTSCYTGSYLYNNQCISSCPQGTYVDNSNFTCFDTCPVGTYPDKNNYTCAICNPYSCNQCSQSGDFCYSCNTNYYLQNGACYYCSVSCYNCTSSNNCHACQFGQFVDGQCVNTVCPTGSFQANVSVCLSCSQNCANCNNQTQCNFCNQGYYLKTTTSQASCFSCPQYCSSCINNGTCYSCFPGYYSIAGTCYPCGSGIIYGSSCTSVVVPFPFTIVSLIILILTVVSYFWKKKTLAFVRDFSLNSLIQTVSNTTLIGLTASMSGSTTCFILICHGFGIGFILSLIITLFGVIKLPQDSYYTEWKNKNKVVYFFCIAFSLILNGRFFFFQFSRAFNSQSLSAALQTKSDFKILRFILMTTLVNALLVVIGCLIGIIQTPQSISVIGNPIWDIKLDCLIVHVIGMTALIIYIISRGKESFETSPNPMDTERSQQTQMSSPFGVSKCSPNYEYL